MKARMLQALEKYFDIDVLNSWKGWIDKIFIQVM
jgi:hypothetical protein